MPADCPEFSTFPVRHGLARTWTILLSGIFFLAASAATAQALNIPGYNSAINDRFTSGYNTNPVTGVVLNSGTNFIGFGYDWSGVCWNDADLRQSFGMISPQHFLVATHFGGASPLKFFGGNGQLYSTTTLATRATGYGPFTPGDVTLGTLTAPLPSSVQAAYYPILDLVPSITSQSYTAYQNSNLFIYGWNARIAAGSAISVGFYQNGYYVSTGSASCAYQDKDSGSPIFIPWTDPTGDGRLTILGAAWAVDSLTNTTTNYHSFLPDSNVATQLNVLMAREGYALRWVRNADTTWTGAINGVFESGSNWTASVPSDAYASFDGGATSQRSISLTSDRNLRGLIFKNSASGGDDFTFQNGSTLTIGRGGIVNYDANDPQIFQCAITLDDAQWWDCGAGGLRVGGNINIGGFLLLIDGAGGTTLAGGISGAGGLAKEGAGTLTMSGSASFTGALFVHNGTVNLTGTSGNTYSGGTVVGGGTLLANNTAGSATGDGAVTVAAGATLGGSGIIAPSGTNGVTVSGALNPGIGGAASTLRFNFSGGNLALANTGSYVFKAGSVSDLAQLNNAQVTLGGVLQISQSAGFSYLNSYKLFSGLSAPPTGSFSSVTGIAPGFTTSYSYNAGDYFVSFTPVTFSAWQLAYFTSAEISGGQADATSDFSKNGVPNLVKYALGMDPKSSSRAGLPVADASGTYLTLTVSKNQNASDVGWIVEVAGDLTNSGSWNSAGTTVVTNTSSSLVVRDNTPVAGAAKRFIRLRVIHP